MIQRFVIEGQLPSRNKVDLENRRNRFAGAKMKRDVTDRVAMAAMSAMNRGEIKPIEKPCIVSVVFVEETRRQDVDNVGSAIKFILDGLQKAKLIHGDSPRYVVATPTWVVYGNEPRAEVTIIDGDYAELFNCVSAAQNALEQPVFGQTQCGVCKCYAPIRDGKKGYCSSIDRYVDWNWFCKDWRRD